MTTRGKASAPAKVILFGEHFVVYGNAAVLAAINRRITVDAKKTAEEKITIRSDIGIAGQYSITGFKIINGGIRAKAALDPLHSAIKHVLSWRETGIEVNISSAIPHGIGLGSSAAACVATAAAVNSLFEKDPSRQKICNIAIEAERMIHVNSSGADCYVSTFGGLMQYSKEDGFTRIRVKETLPLVVTSTMISHSTGDLVARVKRFKERNASLFASLAHEAADICIHARAAIASGNLAKVGELLNENQVILRKIGVSHYKADELIDICMKGGALGAKITGAGGGGAVIALAADKQNSAKIAARVRAAGYESFEARIDRRGLVFG